MKPDVEARTVVGISTLIPAILWFAIGCYISFFVTKDPDRGFMGLIYGALSLFAVPFITLVTLAGALSTWKYQKIVSVLNMTFCALGIAMIFVAVIAG